jgi:hypothetical protein
MNDVLYFLIAPMTVAVLILLYRMYEREWVDLTTEEIFKLWDNNAEKFGSVEQFARALERAIQEKNS